MRTVEMNDVNNLPDLFEEAAKGEPFIIARDGKPLLQVTAIEGEKPQKTRWLGALEGLYTVPDDFDTMADKEMAEMVDIIESKKF